MRSKRLLGFLSGLIAVVLVAVALVNAQAIEDWYRLKGYTPPADMTAIASQDRLSDFGKHILYVARPVLITQASQFNQNCPQSEQTIVLGCYHSGYSPLSSESALFVRTVDDPRLNGVEQVTTAHEMLHAAYDRLSPTARKNVDQMLLDYYKNELKDQRILDTINSYKQSEPNDVVNEMHSIFGTEISTLPPPLENYYKQYFSDRSVVAGYANNYESEFTRRIATINEDKQQLTELKSQIDSEEAQLQSQLADIQSQRSGVERSNDPSVIDQYNATVNSYNSGVRRLRSDIAEYNQIVEEYNSIAADLRSLQDSLDSHLTTQ